MIIVKQLGFRFSLGGGGSQNEIIGTYVFPRQHVFYEVIASAKRHLGQTQVQC